MSDLLLVSSVAESEAIKKLLSALGHEVEEMDDVLIRADSKILPAYERDILLERKRLYQRVISYFQPQQRLKEIEKEIDDNLHNLI